MMLRKVIKETLCFRRSAVGPNGVCVREKGRPAVPAQPCCLHTHIPHVTAIFLLTLPVSRCTFTTVWMGGKGIVFRKTDDWTPKKALRGIIKDILKDSHYLRNCKNLREQKWWGEDDPVGGPGARHASLAFRDRGSIIWEVWDEML